MADEPNITTNKLEVHGEALLTAPRFFAQSTVVHAGPDEAFVLIGRRMTLDGQVVFVPDAQIFMTPAHFRRFAAAVNTQLTALNLAEGHKP